MDEVSSRPAAGYVASWRLATGPMAAAKGAAPRLPGVSLLAAILAAILGLAAMLGAGA